MINQQEYIDIVNAISGIQEMIQVNKELTDDSNKSDFDKFIIQQNKHLKTAIKVMLEKIEGLQYTE